MKKTLIVVGVFIVSMIAAAGIFWGCNSNSGVDGILENAGANRLLNQPTTPLTTFDRAETTAQFMVASQSEKSSALRSVLLKANVVEGSNWLRAQGYSPVDSCVAVFVRYTYRTVIDSPNVPQSSIARPTRDSLTSQILVYADTMVWQAFANPSHDMGNYTGLATAWRNGGPGETILAELDISTQQPRVIRQGKFENGEFEPGDVGVESFKHCVGDCVLGGMVGCALAGPGYLECVGVVATGCVIYCGAQSLWHAIFD